MENSVPPDRRQLRLVANNPNPETGIVRADPDTGIVRVDPNTRPVISVVATPVATPAPIAIVPQPANIKADAAILDGVERFFGPEGLLVKAGREHRPQQLELARTVARCLIDRRCGMAEGAPGTGKCLDPNTPVLRYDGKIVPAKDVRVGDLLMGPDSRPRLVLSTTFGTGPMYRIVPVKGEPWACNDAHILSLSKRHKPSRRTKAARDRGEPRLKKRDPKDDTVIDISIADYMALSATQKHKLKLFQPDFVDFPDQGLPLPVTPYFLGVWLGDGTKALDPRSDEDRLLVVAVTKPDPEIEQCCREEADRFGLEVSSSVPINGCLTHRIVKPGGLNHGAGLSKSDRKNPLLETLRALMSNGICVPAAYLYGSRQTRSEVLAGLLDTDGHKLNNGGGYEIVQKRLRIADDIEFLARSLGLRVSRRTKTVNGDTYHRLFLSGDCSHLPLRIERKKSGTRNQIKNALRTGFSVEPIGNGDFYGFTLDGDGRFLLGDFTVTHNSYAHLVPLILYAIHYNTRGVVAVGTNALTEQLRSDIPKILEILGTGVSYAVVKGRNNTVCQRNEQATKNAWEDDGNRWARKAHLHDEDIDQLVPLLEWTSRGGADLTQYSATLRPKVHRLVTITGEACKDARENENEDPDGGCEFDEFFDEGIGQVIRPLRCNHLLARRLARKAKIVITNFDVLLWNYRTDGGILGKFKAVVLDEAHEWAGKTRDHFSVSVSGRYFENTADNLVKKIPESIHKSNSTPELQRNAEQAARLLAGTSLEFFKHVRRLAEARMKPRDRREKSFETLLFAVGEEKLNLIAATRRLFAACALVAESAEKLGLSLDDFDRRDTVAQILTSLGPMDPKNNFAINVRLDGLDNPEGVRVYLTLVPIGLAGYMRQTIHLNSKHTERLNLARETNDAAHIAATRAEIRAEAAAVSGNDSTVVAISATLTPDGTWDFPKSELAMPDDVICCSVESPFDFRNNATWYVPRVMPPSGSEEAVRDIYNRAASVQAMNLVRIVGGRTLVLCSRRDDMSVAAKALRHPEAGGYTVYVQEVDGTAAELTKRFKKDPTSCLIGSKTFGTGFDVPGAALECVVVWKLPYRRTTPVDELLKKRLGDGVWTNMVYTPAMLIDLRQWIGRLIRQKNDIGVIVILDAQKFGRLSRQLRGAMPKGIPLVRTMAEVDEFLIRVRGR